MSNIIENISLSVLKLIVDTVGQLSNGIKLASKEGFTSGKMLDYIYKNEPSGKLLIGKFIDKIYLNHPGWCDIRNRKNNMCLNMQDAIDDILQTKQEVIICDVASGPARYILDTLEANKGKNIKAQLRDIDVRWLKEAKEAANKRDVEVEYKVANALEEKDFVFDKQPDIMVASGFYDWFNDIEVLRKSMRLIYNSLAQGGYFVFSVQAGHHALTLTNKVFKDFNNHQLKMVTWDMETINSILNEIGFEIVKERADEQRHYPVILAQKK